MVNWADWVDVLEKWDWLLEGLETTLELTALAILIAFIAGILMAFGRAYGKPPLSTIIYVYEKVFRGIPLLVIFFMVFYGGTQLGINLDPFPAAVIGLALRSTAYQAQIFRTSINSIPQGQMTAARALGMSKWEGIRSIILPQALRVSVPGWKNEFTIVLKDTSIALGISVVELLRQGQYIYNRPLAFDLAFPTLVIIAIIYFILVFAANKSLDYVEKKYRIPGYEVEVER